MKRHDFDVVSFIFGVLFLLAGVPLLVSEAGWDFLGERWVFPAVLVGAGLAVLLSTNLTGRNREDEDMKDPFA